LSFSNPKNKEISRGFLVLASVDAHYFLLKFRKIPPNFAHLKFGKEKSYPN
jgi:hypothetical protein